MPPAQHLSHCDEKVEYDLHRNNPDDPGYRNFLSRLYKPMHSRLNPQSRGLDFGSGPGPTLSLMFAEAGYEMEIYDPFYADRPAVLEKQYDFITASEVVEHLRDPAGELHRLWSCLRKDGILGIMTKLVIDREAFAGWHYKNDRTHIGFFSRFTFNWLANGWRAELQFIDKDVILLSKTESS